MVRLDWIFVAINTLGVWRLNVNFGCVKTYARRGTDLVYI